MRCSISAKSAASTPPASARIVTIVRVVELGGDLAVDVVDQGGGVPEHLRARIFEPFFTTKDRGQGTGLGLSISAKIASEHQGRIEVLDGPGGGSVFRVVLPQYRRG